MGRLRIATKYSGLAAFGLLSLAVGVVSWPTADWRGLAVQTGSMRPALDPGDLVITRRVVAGELRVGDIVTYAVPGQRQTVTHRIVGIGGGGGQPRQFSLQGDANPAPDPPVSERQIIGKVTHSLPLVGQLADALRTPLGLALLVYLPALSVVWGELRRLSHYYEVRALRSPQKPRSLVIRPSMLIALIAALPLLGAMPTWAAWQGRARLTGNTISVAPPPASHCQDSGPTSIHVSNDTSQTATTGSTTVSGNTAVGSATTGPATNSSTTSTTVTTC